MSSHGFDHVVATWELMFSSEWLRSFAPWEHKARVEWVGGEWHGLDTCFRTQIRTDPDRCQIDSEHGELIHFNHVISQYRRFLAGLHRPHPDRGFVLLLIRLLSDAVGEAGASVNGGASVVPTLDELVAGLEGHASRVTYRSDGIAAHNYPIFRAKLSRVLAGPLFDDAVAESVLERLAPFDAAFG
jgi:hypothetical protein